MPWCLSRNQMRRKTVLFFEGASQYINASFFFRRKYRKSVPLSDDPESWLCNLTHHGRGWLSGKHFGVKADGGENSSRERTDLLFVILGAERALNMSLTNAHPEREG